jgi:precorrin-2 dehydrogenase
MPAYPINLNLNGRTVLVVGLGQVGRRKAEALVTAGARVIAVDPDARKLNPVEGVEVVSDTYHSAHLRSVSLVIAAGPPDVNRQVVADARRRGIWVCSSSDPDEGDFTIPAVWNSGPLVVSVSTSGASPALASVLRDRAAAALGPAAAGLAEILAELRPLVLDRVVDHRTRQRIFREWADPRWLSLWTEQGPEAVHHALRELINREHS